LLARFRSLLKSSAAFMKGDIPMEKVLSVARDNTAGVVISGGTVNGPVIGVNNGAIHYYSLTINSDGTQIADGGKLVVTTLETAAIIPRAPRIFSDREGPITDLIQELQPGGGAWITGPRGCGVTMLLRKLVNEPAAQQLPHGIIYLDDVLAPDGLAETLQVLYNYYHRGNAPIAVTMQEAHEFLSKRQALFALDHLPLSHDELISLSDTLRMGATLIAAESAGPDTLGSIQLQGLPRHDAVTLLTNVAYVDITKQDTASAIAQICTALSDLPLPLVLAGRLLRERLMTASQIAESLQELTSEARLAGQRYDNAQAHGDPLTLAAILLFQVMSPDERAILSVLTHVGQVDLSALAAISQVSTALVDQAVQRLRTLGLVVSGNNRYRVSFASLRRVFTSLLPLKDELRRAAIFYGESALVQSHDLKWLAREQRHILAAIEELLANGRTAQAGVLARTIQPALALDGNWHTWRRVLQFAEQAATTSGDDALMAWVFHERGTVAGLMGDRAAAKTDLDMAQKRRLELGDKRGAAASQHNLRYFGLIASSAPAYQRKVLAGMGAAVLVLIAAWLLTGPVAAADTASSEDRLPFDLRVLANDTAGAVGLDQSTLAITIQPAHGIATVDTQTGQIAYRPADSFSGVDVFHYQICDRLRRCVHAQVRVTIGGTPSSSIPTPLIPTLTASATPAPTAPPTDTTTIVPTNPPTAIPTNTPLPPTAMPTDTPTAAPTDTPTPTATPIVDKTPPSVSNITFSQSPVSLGVEGKPADPLLITTTVVDQSGIRSVHLRYRLSNKDKTGPWHTVPLTSLDGDRYGLQINLGAEVNKDGLSNISDGQIEYMFIAIDRPGNRGTTALKAEPYRGFQIG
jgi:hypothetical protein